jgi:hypothetical protein
MARRNANSIERKRLKSLLEAVFTVCALQDKIDDAELAQMVEEARARGQKRVSSLSRNRGSAVDFDALGLVIHRWQRSAKYLNDDGQTFPIPARGAAPSIEALFREIRRARYFDLGLKHLVQLKRVRRTKGGDYLPLDATTIVPTLTPELFEVLSQTIQRLVGTVLHNTSLRGGSSVRLIERLTSVPDLPKKQMHAFKSFAREQGAALIGTMNEWLEGHRGKRKSRLAGASDRVTAGLHVFGFIDNEN